MGNPGCCRAVRVLSPALISRPPPPPTHIPGPQGVGLSVDGGATFKTYDANLDGIARFGAFPTDTTWYVASGTSVGRAVGWCPPCREEGIPPLTLLALHLPGHTHRRMAR